MYPVLPEMVYAFWPNVYPLDNHFLALPEAFAQGLDPEEFPLPVDLDWKDAIGPCQGTMIEVECIKRR